MLEVEFSSGSVYRYSGVPRSTFDALMRSASKGGYLDAHIKDRYSYRRVR
jgi:hypothetical protein